MKTVKASHWEDIPFNFTGIVEWHDGGKEWYVIGKRHREDGPAIERHDGTKAWMLNDKLHREDGPARVWSSGTKAWWLNGKLHRVDGPAVEHADGSKQWWLNYNHIFTLEPIVDYIVIEDGLPSTVKWLGNPVSTLKVLTAEGIKFIPNLPGV